MVSLLLELKKKKTIKNKRSKYHGRFFQSSIYYPVFCLSIFLLWVSHNNFVVGFFLLQLDFDSNRIELWIQKCGSLMSTSIFVLIKYVLFFVHNSLCCRWKPLIDLSDFVIYLTIRVFEIAIWNDDILNYDTCRVSNGFNGLSLAILFFRLRNVFVLKNRLRKVNKSLQSICNRTILHEHKPIIYQ